MINEQLVVVNGFVSELWRTTNKILRMLRSWTKDKYYTHLFDPCIHSSHVNRHRLSCDELNCWFNTWQKAGGRGIQHVQTISCIPFVCGGCCLKHPPHSHLRSFKRIAGLLPFFLVRYYSCVWECAWVRSSAGNALRPANRPSLWPKRGTGQEAQMLT